MNKITKEFLLGEEKSAMFTDEYQNIYIFDEENNGIKRSKEGEFVDYFWKLNENGILSIILDNNVQKFWKMKNEINKDTVFLIQEYIKTEEEKPVPNQTFTVERSFYDNTEEKIKNKNEGKLKEILKKYNYVNYIISIFSLIVFSSIFFLIANNIFIIKDFTLFFKLIILALSLIFFIRPLMLFSHQISYKIRRKFEK
jgi:hypothetical protein